MNKYLKSISVFSIFLISLFPIAFSQISYGGTPLPVHEKEAIHVIDLTGSIPDFEEQALKQVPDKHQPYRFADNVSVDITPENSGTWEVDENDLRIWRVRIIYKKAYSLSLLFNRYKLEKGEKIFVYDPQGHTILGAFTEANNKPWGTLPVQPVPGSSLIIEYEVPACHDVKDKLSVGQVGIGFRDIFNHKQAKDDFFHRSGACNVDINCPEGENWQVEKNAVVRVFVNNNELCTGVLMNTALNNATPYLLTAGHCIEDSADAVNAIFVFGYESPYCHGPDGSVFKSLAGSELRATISNLDFALVRLSQIPPFTYYPYFAGWDHTGSVPTSTVTIHHPNGDVKKISIDDDPPATSDYDVYDKNSFWQIKQWDAGTTEQGSSGAPLFDPNHRVIGTLSGGDASCGNSINDYFQKLLFTWDAYPDSSNQLKYWLDPQDFNFSLYNGYDPYSAAKRDCDTLTNIQEGEALRLYDYGGPDAGYWTGHNESRITQYAERFYNSSLFSMTGIYIMPAIVQHNDPSDKVTIKIWSGTQKPENLIASKDVAFNYFQDSVWNFIDFDSIITIPGNFFAGYKIYYDNPDSGPLTDQFAVFQVEGRDIYGDNTAFYYEKNVWTSYSGTPALNLYTSLAIQPVLCREIPCLHVQEYHHGDSSGILRLYPNPATGEVTLSIPNTRIKNGSLKIYDLTGKVLFEGSMTFTAPETRVRLPGLRKGMYVIMLKINNRMYRNKLIISNK